MQNDRFAVLLMEMTERKTTEDRRAALMELDNRFRGMLDPAEMAFAAVETIGRTLTASTLPTLGAAPWTWSVAKVRSRRSPGCLGVPG